MDKRIRPDVDSTTAFITAFQRLDETRFAGHVLWRDAPHLHFIVEILIDSEPVGLVRADNFSAPLKTMRCPDDHGFVFLARKHQLAGQHQIEARIANLALPIGTPIDLKMQPFIASAAHPVNRVEWLGGLRLAGTIAAGKNESVSRPSINVHENGVLIAQTSARRWVSPTKMRDDLAAARFDFHLPSAFADGSSHRLTVTDETGRELEGSPVHVLAFSDPLRSLIEREPHLAVERTRAEWFDRFLPMSAPFENFDEWKHRFARPLLTLENEPPVRVVVMGGENADETLSKLNSQKYSNWSATVLQSGRGGRFEWRDLKEAVTADADKDSIVIFLRPSVVLHDDAIAQLVKALTDHSSAQAAYGDIEIVSPNGLAKPLFFGAFDYERMLEQGYAATLFALRTSGIKIPTDEKAGNLARLLLALCDADGANSGSDIVHVPGLLATLSHEALPSPAEIEAAASAHLRMRKVKAQIRPANGSSLPAIHVRRAALESSISIVIPTRNRVDLLAPCIDSILTKTARKKLDIVIVDNGSSAPDTLAFLKAHQRKGNRVVDAAGPFNYSHLNNVGVAAAKGEIICLLNNDTEVVDPHWLDELLSRLSDPTVGAVAPKLIWPNQMVQHGGIVLGPNFAASDAFNDCLDNDPGYGDLLRVAHEATALTAACMLVRRQDYMAVKGFDEIAFPVLFNDVDFCLRLRALGKRNVFTPHTSLLHHESATRQRDIHYSQKSRFQRELRLLRSRWANVLANDPLYSPFLNLDPYPYSALAWPPRPAGPRLNTVAAPTTSLR
jgi:GT2 family glycosyltransferase